MNVYILSNMDRSLINTSTTVLYWMIIYCTLNRTITAALKHVTPAITSILRHKAVEPIIFFIVVDYVGHSELG